MKRELTSSKCQDVLDAEGLRLEQVRGDHVLRLIGTCDVQHGFQTTVIEGSTRDGHGTSLLVSPRISRWVPRDVAEQRPACKHPVKPVNEVYSTSSCTWWEELEGEEGLLGIDLCL